VKAPAQPDKSPLFQRRLRERINHRLAVMAKLSRSYTHQQCSEPHAALPHQHDQHLQLAVTVHPQARSKSPTAAPGAASEAATAVESERLIFESDRRIGETLAVLLNLAAMADGLPSLRLAG
jgi:hypothetical protein